MKYFAAMIMFSILMLVGCKDQIADSATEQNILQDKHLIFYMPFNNEIKDQTGNAKPVLSYGIQSTKNRFDKSASAYYFNGNSFISCGDLADINSGSLTVSAWIKCTDYDQSAKIVSKGQSLSTSPSNSGYSLRIVSNGMYPTTSSETELWFQIIDDNGTREYVGIAISKLERNNYIMITGTYDNTVSPSLLKLYINSYLVAMKEVKLTKSNTSGNLSIGALDRGMNGSPSQYDEFFKGSIDDVMIYDRPLNDAELKSLHDRNE